MMNFAGQPHVDDGALPIMTRIQLNEKTQFSTTFILEINVQWHLVGQCLN